MQYVFLGDFDFQKRATTYPLRVLFIEATDLRGKEKAKNNETVTDAKAYIRGSSSSSKWIYGNMMAI